MSQRLKVLFLCTGNSCRSQMAEGFARALKGEQIEAYSAGTSPQGLNPLAVKAMAEIGIDISSHKSKSVDELQDVIFDFVVSVCDQAKQSCPTWLGAGKLVHHSFDDPPRLAQSARTEAEALQAYRKVRDEIKAFVETLSQILEET